MKSFFRILKRSPKPTRPPAPHSIEAFSQEGEDMILRRVFEGRERGFYVDVGAHHPQRFSNTYYFYRQGWSGINIEPNPEITEVFRAIRPRDIHLQTGVSDQAGELTYHFFDEAALNTFDPALARSRVGTTPYKLLRTATVPVERLETLLERHLPAGQRIDFLSVDVEGLDLRALRSNDWSRYRPACVLAEALSASLEESMRGELFRFMTGQGYELLAKTFNTLIFQETRPA